MLCYLLLPDVECSGGPSVKNKVVPGVCFCCSMPDWNNSTRYQSPGQCFHFLPVINSAGHFMSLLLHIQMWLRQHLLSRGGTFQFPLYFRNPPFQKWDLSIPLAGSPCCGCPHQLCTSQTALTSNTGDTWALGFCG